VRPQAWQLDRAYRGIAIDRTREYFCEYDIGNQSCVRLDFGALRRLPAARPVASYLVHIHDARKRRVYLPGQPSRVLGVPDRRLPSNHGLGDPALLTGPAYPLKRLTSDAVFLLILFLFVFVLIVLAVVLEPMPLYPSAFS